ncbi:MAG: transcriptional regulator TetR family [Herbinix sp.]|nr:transcriptional regulator TetR family [Herbinix sp.]
MGINLLHRKEQLVLTTIDIIDELGIQKLTTREIAKRQEISEATLFRHFKNKNELLAAVIDYFIQFDADILQSAKLHDLAPTKALIYLITSYAEYYENYKAIASILQIFDVLQYEADLSDKIKEVQLKRTSTLQLLIEEAKQAGEFSKDIDSNMVAVMISGLFREICFNWKITNYNFSLRERTLSTLDLLLTALHNKS